jgi:heterodisulfide reductase subunit A
MTDSSPNVLILGGGVAGLSAAEYLGSRGLQVYLVEKADHLGGKARDWACMATDKCRHCGACLCAELVDRVNRLENVTVFLESTLSALEKKNDTYDIALSGNGPEKIEAGAVLIATGMSLYDPAEQPDLGYTDHDNVITTAELNVYLK